MHENSLLLALGCVCLKIFHVWFIGMCGELSISRSFFISDTTTCCCFHPSMILLHRSVLFVFLQHSVTCGGLSSVNTASRHFISVFLSCFCLLALRGFIVLEYALSSIFAMFCRHFSLAVLITCACCAICLFRLYTSTLFYSAYIWGLQK
jgi:hypothetical protein